MTAIEIFEHRGKEIGIYYDEFADNPNEFSDEVYLIYEHRDFAVSLKYFDLQTIFERHNNKKKMYEDYWIFPVFLYSHSGCAISLQRENHGWEHWDTSFCGFMLVKQLKGDTWMRVNALEKAQKYIEEWNRYLSGEIYLYTWQHGSCGGFYGIDFAKEAAIESINQWFIENDTQLKIPFEYAD